MPDTSYQEMINVKKQFFKTDGIQCFHAVQSFVKGEITPEQAHEIGMKLAEELWGDKFQVVVTTHLNTDNLHNHFVLNSVSFLDGKRFCNTKKDYAIMRKTSDGLCEEYGLNVLSQEEKYNKYATSSLYKELMKDSIDYAIANAKDYNEFIKILQDLGYIITDKNNSLSIRHDSYKRNTRIERQFESKYSKENIYKRILETQPLYPYSSNPMVLITRTYENYNKQKEKRRVNFMGHISTVEVRYAETDQMGIAHHSNYAIWFEVARTDFIKAAGISYTDVEKEGIITPLTSLECKYKKAAFYEDQLQIHASLTKLSPVRLEFSYKVTRDGDLIATGKTTHGMVTKDLKPINVKKEHPEIYRMFENALD